MTLSSSPLINIFSLEGYLSNQLPIGYAKSLGARNTLRGTLLCFMKAIPFHMPYYGLWGMKSYALILLDYTQL